MRIDHITKQGIRPEPARPNGPRQPEPVSSSNPYPSWLITHFTRILRYVRPDHVQVFLDGRIVDEGGPELADAIEADGYASYITAAATA